MTVGLINSEPLKHIAMAFKTKCHMYSVYQAQAQAKVTFSSMRYLNSEMWISLQARKSADYAFQHLFDFDLYVIQVKWASHDQHNRNSQPRSLNKFC